MPSSCSMLKKLANLAGRTRGSTRTYVEISLPSLHSHVAMPCDLDRLVFGWLHSPACLRLHPRLSPCNELYNVIATRFKCTVIGVYCPSGLLSYLYLTTELLPLHDLNALSTHTNSDKKVCSLSHQQTHPPEILTSFPAVDPTHLNKSHHLANKPTQNGLRRPHRPPSAPRRLPLRRPLIRPPLLASPAAEAEGRRQPQPRRDRARQAGTAPAAEAGQRPVEGGAGLFVRVARRGRQAEGQRPPAAHERASEGDGAADSEEPP